MRLTGIWVLKLLRQEFDLCITVMVEEFKCAGTGVLEWYLLSSFGCYVSDVRSCRLKRTPIQGITLSRPDCFTNGPWDSCLLQLLHKCEHFHASSELPCSALAWLNYKAKSSWHAVREKITSKNLL